MSVGGLHTGTLHELAFPESEDTHVGHQLLLLGRPAPDALVGTHPDGAAAVLDDVADALALQGFGAGFLLQSLLRRPAPETTLAGEDDVAGGQHTQGTAVFRPGQHLPAFGGEGTEHRVVAADTGRSAHPDTATRIDIKAVDPVVGETASTHGICGMHTQVFHGAARGLVEKVEAIAEGRHGKAPIGQFADDVDALRLEGSHAAGSTGDGVIAPEAVVGTEPVVSLSVARQGFGTRRR